MIMIANILTTPITVLGMAVLGFVRERFQFQLLSMCPARTIVRFVSPLAGSTLLYTFCDCPFLNRKSIFAEYVNTCTAARIKSNTVVIRLAIGDT